MNEKLKLASNKIKVIRKNSPFIFVCFRNDVDRDNAIQAITNFKWKGTVLTAVVSKVDLISLQIILFYNLLES